MNLPSSKINLFDLAPPAMERFVVALGEKRFRAAQLLKWIYHHQASDFEQMTDIGKAFRARLEIVAELALPKVLLEKVSEDGTVKWLLAMNGGSAIETVFIPEANRGTLCVSSQIGCALDCGFCSTGKQGFNRNLSTAEIIGQVWVAAQRLGSVHRNNALAERRISNVVMMGMGEPLRNFNAVTDAMDLMRHDFGFGLANRRVTLSTAGLVPGIDALSERCDVSLAVSLHAPFDELREQLMPINRKYPIADLLAACQRYQARRPRSSITFEYTLMKDVNDRPEHARALVKLLRKLPSKLNLIPFNPFPGADYRRSEPEAIATFKQIVMQAGLIATVRKTRGDDIDAACGQLAGQVIDRTRRSREHQARRKVAADAA